MFKIKDLNFNKGFTLIELMLYVAISSLIIFVISVFLISVMNSRIKSATIREVEDQGRKITEVITTTIRNAENINTPTQGNSGNNLSLSYVNASVNPTLFDLDNGVLRIKEGIDPYINLNNSKVVISSLSFSNLSRSSTPGIIQVSFTISYVNNLGLNEYEYSKQFTSAVSLRK